jgi:hypothetical protein
VKSGRLTTLIPRSSHRDRQHETGPFVVVSVPLLRARPEAEHLPTRQLSHLGIRRPIPAGHRLPAYGKNADANPCRTSRNTSQAVRPSLVIRAACNLRRVRSAVTPFALEAQQSESSAILFASIVLAQQAIEHGVRRRHAREQGCTRAQFQIVGRTEDVPD